MTALLALITVAAFGTWIPTSQAVPGVPQRVRTLYAGAGNVVWLLVPSWRVVATSLWAGDSSGCRSPGG